MQNIEEKCNFYIVKENDCKIILKYRHKGFTMEISRTLKSVISFILILIAFSFLPSLLDKLKTWYETYVEEKTSVAVIDIKGVLYDSSGYTKQLKKYFKNDEIKAILLKIDCPGSAAGTGQIIFDEILALKQEYPKPIITMVENVCASGGYYIACATDYIIAPGSAIVGSIGTAFPYLFQLHDFIDQYKIKTVPLKAGEFKAVGSPFTDITDAEKSLLQGVLDDSYRQFAQDVAQQRKISLNDKTQWAEGKIFTARQAKNLHLVDALGGSVLAEKIIKERAEIIKEIRWVRKTKSGGLLSILSSNEGDGGAFNSLINTICTVLEQRYAAQIVH